MRQGHHDQSGVFADAYNNRGAAYAALGQYERAIAECDKAITINPGEARAYNNRGLTYADLQRYDESLRDYTRAIELDPQLAQAYVNAGVLFANRSRWCDALPYFEGAAELGDPKGTAYAARARQELGMDTAPQENPAQRAFEELQAVRSLADMEAAVTRFPFMTDAKFINAVEQVIHQQVPLEHHPAFVQRLAWLQQIANEQQGKENTQ